MANFMEALAQVNEAVELASAQLPTSETCTHMFTIYITTNLAIKVKFMKTMKLYSNRHNRLRKQGLRMSRDSSLTLETHRIIMAVRNNSIPSHYNPNELNPQVMTGLQKQ